MYAGGIFFRIKERCGMIIRSKINYKSYNSEDGKH